jgi:Cu+-exporting ATPase
MAYAQPTEIDLQCYHCGQPCDDLLWYADKPFCCQGCQTVFEILSANDLCEYYSLEQAPGIQQRSLHEETYSYLDEPAIRKKVLLFDSESFARVQFSIPAIHCVSCIWLLEHVQKLTPGVLRSEVNFARKSVTIDLKPDQLSLGALAAVLASIGYPPKINLDSERQAHAQGVTQKSLVLKLAIAGFCFGNVMLFSFPEYLGLAHGEESLQNLFSYLNILLSLPVLLYSDRDYLVSGWQTFRQRQINIDVPIAVGLLALFGRSVWEILSGYGPGYLDSFTGLVFFLLIGRWFQNKTYDSLAFDRDYRSYFPLAVQRLEKTEWRPVVIYQLEKGDQIRIRNMEIIPADSLLLNGEAYIDYSFVTGEARPEKRKAGELIYAGGRLIGEPVTLVVEKNTSQSHLTSLWNNEAFHKSHESRYKKIIDLAARRFTWVVLVIGMGTAAYWYWAAPDKVWLTVTAVLMVACPCALALAAPFTYGNVLRVFGRHGLYLKNADVVERLATITGVVFDKTGTITHGEQPDIRFVGDLNEEEAALVRVLTSYSTHPLSNLLARYIPQRTRLTVTDFKEYPGKGIEGKFGAIHLRVGSAAWMGFEGSISSDASHVFVSVNGGIRGYYQIKTSVRNGLKGMIGRLGKRVVALVSGDNAMDVKRMETLFPAEASLLFHQSPHDKLAFVQQWQHLGRHVLMLGDGLNDSGALKQSDVGLAVTDDTGVFTPACDGILQGSQVKNLDVFLALSHSATTILKTGFVISFMYNAIALSFAVSGFLTPLVAAILMPISSISVVTFSTVAVNLTAARYFKPSIA